PYGPVFPLPEQTAFFVRGDSLLVHTALDLNRHPLAVRGELDVGIVLSSGDGTESVVNRTPGVSSRYALRTIVADQAQVVSVEAVSVGGGVGRSRFAYELGAAT